MPNRSTDVVYQLIKSMEKGEKRNFKLYVNRNGGGGESLKIVTLFDGMDKLDKYDEDILLKKNPTIKKQQLSNLKAYLYKEILSSIRLINDTDNIDIQLREQMDFARILYNKGLYLQSLKILDKLKEVAKTHHQITHQLQAILLEKKIEALHITRSMPNRAQQLSNESASITSELNIVNQFSSLALELYSWYIQHGHARDAKEVAALEIFFSNNLPVVKNDKSLSIYEKLYQYQCYCWYGFIKYDLLLYYRYCQKWVDLFEKNSFLKNNEAAQYIRGYHNLLGAHFMLGNHEKMKEGVKDFEAFTNSDLGNKNMNNKIQCFVYLHIAKINQHFNEGTFTKGLELVPYIEQKLKEYELHLDAHRVLVFYYKIACLYFGSGNNDKAIDYLNKIINRKTNLRTDLQCYARLLHLISHYELGNYDILEYLIKSVYRFMANMNNLSVVEEEMFRFIRKSFSLTPDKIVPALKILKQKLEKLAANPLESRSFMYLDVLAWLEAKITKVPVQDVRRKAYLAGRKKK
jgi:hypothetical protein